MFRSDIQGKRKGSYLTSYRGYTDHTLWVRGGGFANFTVGRRAKPSGNGNLGCAKRVSEVDVQGSVVAYVTSWRVLGGAGAGWDPVVAEVRFKDAGAGADLSHMSLYVILGAMLGARLRYQHLRTPYRPLQTCCSDHPMISHSS